MISLKNVSKKFGSLQAVDNLSLNIDKGEVVGLLGPNGAGKSTTMRLLTGYLYPDAGSITINGIDVVQNPTAAQELLGYLPENNPLYKDMLVADFIKLSADLKHIQRSKYQDALAFAVDSTNLHHVFYQPIGELSKGYKQRVGLAAALIHQPELLILDEPSEGLDPNQRTETRALIKNLSKKHTIILSTHVMQEVTAVCDRIIIINHGKLIADGTQEQLSTGLGGTTLHLTLEGKKILTTLKTLKEIARLKADKITNTKFNVQLTAKKGAKLEPLISRLAHQNDWVIWQLNSQSQDLEDIFHSLTLD
jgi:ABC-2 type transport system ATP-binding protein